MRLATLVHRQLHEPAAVQHGGIPKRQADRRAGPSSHQVGRALSPLLCSWVFNDYGIGATTFFTSAEPTKRKAVEILEWRIEEGIHQKKTQTLPLSVGNKALRLDLLLGWGDGKLYRLSHGPCSGEIFMMETNQLGLDVETCNRRNDIPGRTTDGIRKPRLLQASSLEIFSYSLISICLFTLTYIFAEFFAT